MSKRRLKVFVVARMLGAAKGSNL